MSQDPGAPGNPGNQPPWNQPEWNRPHWNQPQWNQPGRQPNSTFSQLSHAWPLFFVGAIAMLVLAWMIPGAAVDTEPLPVLPGRSVSLPDLSVRANEVYLFGDHSDVDTDQTQAGLGCTFAEPVSTTGPPRKLHLDKRPMVGSATVGGAQLYSIFGFMNYADGTTMTCSGPEMADYAPLYVMGASDTDIFVRLMFVMMAFVAVAMGLVLRSSRPGSS